MMTMLLLSLAGGLGAASRFQADAFVARHNPFRVPIGTVVINVTGSFVLGVVTGLVVAGAPGSTLQAVVGTGFCGGYTTFSTASVEATRLWIAEGRATGSGYAVVTLVASVAAAAIGLVLGRLVA